MDEAECKKRVQKLIEQIGALKLVDPEAYKYFSQKAMEALETISSGNYTPILNLQDEMLDFMLKRYKENENAISVLSTVVSEQQKEINKIRPKTKTQIQNQELPVLVEKPSLISRIQGLLSRKSEKSEIDKIAERLLTMDSENTEMQSIEDKRREIYDFFNNNIYDMVENPYYSWGIKQTVQYTIGEKEKNFVIKNEKSGVGEIRTSIGIIATYYNNGKESINTAEEYLRLIKFDQFINSQTGNTMFLNELGRRIEEDLIKRQATYSPFDTCDIAQSGHRLHKTLLKDPIYMQTKKSFDRAYKEFKRTRYSYLEKKEEEKETKSLSERYKLEETNEPIETTEIETTNMRRTKSTGDKEPADD